MDQKKPLHQTQETAADAESEPAKEPGAMTIKFNAKDKDTRGYPPEVRAIIGEAASEGYEGMLAVAEGIRNRGTLKGVYGFNADFVDKEPDWVWEQASKAWDASKSSDTIKGATHWESTDFPVPPWSKGMDTVAHIGKHKFYKEKE